MTLTLDALTKTYPGVTVLRGVNATFAPGQVVALLGNNGVGKSTLLRCLTGLASPNSGRVLFDGEELLRDRIDLRRKLMFLPDFPSSLPGFDVLQTVAAHLKMWEADRPGVEDIVADVMKRLQIEHLAGASVPHLSRGHSYKVALTCLRAVDPELWLLDEPFASGMDPQGITTFREEAHRAAQERQRLIIYSTQLTELACAFSDQIAVIQNGDLRLFDTQKDLHRDPARLQSLIQA